MAARHLHPHSCKSMRAVCSTVAQPHSQLNESLSGLGSGQSCGSQMSQKAYKRKICIYIGFPSLASKHWNPSFRSWAMSGDDSQQGSRIYIGIKQYAVRAAPHKGKVGAWRKSPHCIHSLRSALKSEWISFIPVPRSHESQVVNISQWKEPERVASGVP